MVAAAQERHDEHGGPLEVVYVWDLVVRLTHWLIAFSIIVLTVTGIDIARPFLDEPTGASKFGHGWVRVVHFYAAIVFSLAVGARILWMFLGPRRSGWRQFIPVSRRRRREMVQTALFYMAIKPRPPMTVGHNPMAGAVYVGVFLMYIVMILTGFALYSVSAYGSYMKMWSFLLPLFHGAQGARWLHHVVMWVILMFVVNHLFSAVLGSITEKNGALDSIFTGYKFLPKGSQRDDDV